MSLFMGHDDVTILGYVHPHGFALVVMIVHVLLLAVHILHLGIGLRLVRGVS